MFIEDTIGAIHEFQVLVKDNGGNANYSEDTSNVKVRTYSKQFLLNNLSKCILEFHESIG